MVLPVVDFPQPDSPTRPSVSPRSTSKLTPSTARTAPTWRWRTPRRIGKCIIKLSTRRRALFVLVSVTISDVSRSWYRPSKLRDGQGLLPSTVGFPSSNVPMPICNAAQKDRHLAFRKEPAAALQWNKVLYVPSRQREAGCPANQSYKDELDWRISPEQGTLQ